MTMRVTIIICITNNINIQNERFTKNNSLEHVYEYFNIVLTLIALELKLCKYHCRFGYSIQLSKLCNFDFVTII